MPAQGPVCSGCVKGRQAPAQLGAEFLPPGTRGDEFQQEPSGIVPGAGSSPPHHFGNPYGLRGRKSHEAVGLGVEHFRVGLFIPLQEERFSRIRVQPGRWIDAPATHGPGRSQGRVSPHPSLKEGLNPGQDPFRDHQPSPCSARIWSSRPRQDRSTISYTSSKPPGPP